MSMTLRREGQVPGSHCSPRHRTPFDLRTEGSKCMSMTWRAISGSPHLAAHTLYNPTIRITLLSRHVTEEGEGFMKKARPANMCPQHHLF